MNEIIIDKLKAKGYRLTPQRRLIVEAIAGSGGPVTAAEVWEIIRKHDAGIGLDTVYRNINMLVELGALLPITGKGKDGSKYELAKASEHHHHIVCVKCGTAACLDYCPVDPGLGAAVRSQGYELVRHNFELYGVCAGCRNS